MAGVNLDFDLTFIIQLSHFDVDVRPQDICVRHLSRDDR